MQRKDLYLLGVLFLAVLMIFYPICFTDFIYTDEVVQIWNYRPGSDFNMYGIQGRWIPEILLSRLFSSIHTIHEIVYIRLLAMLIWFVCIPVWYSVIKRIVAKAPGYEYLPFFTCLYLVTSLPFAVSIQWATCMELSIANTAGLLAGSILYVKIRDREKLYDIPIAAAVGAMALGLLSLFTYQSGFGAFLIPFLFHYISAYTTNKDIVFIKGVAFYFLMYAVYFVLFKLSLSVNHVSSDARAALHINIFDKLQFFFSHPLKRAFWFNVIAADQNKLARAIYKVLFVGLLVLAFVRFGKANWMKALKYIIAVVLVFLISYLPSLVVKENYSSNRTLPALNMCVWIVCIEMVAYLVKNVSVRKVMSVAMACILLLFGWYNFNKQFLQPVKEEYAAVRNFIFQHYHPGIKTVYFIKAAEDAFRTKYHIQSSMDEFGVPSTYVDWVPEGLTRQLVYEKTGDRKMASELVIKYWSDKESFEGSGEAVTSNTLLVNVPVIINTVTPPLK